MADRLMFELPDEAATLAFGAALAAGTGRLGGRYMALSGDLGAGKTTLVRGLLRELGYRGRVKSPTFTLVEPYDLAAGLALFHFDLYRLGHPDELEFLGVDGYFSARSLCVVEWPERAGDWLPEPDLALHLSVAGSGRRVEVAGAAGWPEVAGMGIAGRGAAVSE